MQNHCKWRRARGAFAVKSVDNGLVTITIAANVLVAAGDKSVCWHIVHANDARSVFILEDGSGGIGSGAGGRGCVGMNFNSFFWSSWCLLKKHLKRRIKRIGGCDHGCLYIGKAESVAANIIKLIELCK